MKVSIKKVKGFTLLEIFISLAIGLFIFAGVMSVFVGLRTTTEETASYGEMQENGRLAMSIITEDLMRTGFWGDMSGDLTTALLTENATPALRPSMAAGAECAGDGLNNGTFPADNGHFRVIWGTRTPANGTDPTPFSCAGIVANDGTDAIQIKRVLAQPEAGALSGNRFYFAANGNFGTIFSGAAALADIPEVENAQTWEYQHHLYYIADSAQGVPELRRASLSIPGAAGWIGNIDSVELVEGIENMRFLYGVDDDDDGVVDAYVPEDVMTAAQWDNNAPNKIISVQVFILVREILPDPRYQNTNTYNLGDIAINANDNFRRLLFSSTVVLHNTRTEIWE
mgnify:CR=1 FL=1